MNKQPSTNHLAVRNSSFSMCGHNTEGKNTIWADAFSVVKNNPEYKGIQFCMHCLKVFRTKNIRQLTAEECRKA